MHLPACFLIRYHFAVIIFLHAVAALFVAKPDIVNYNILLVLMDIYFVVTCMCYQFVTNDKVFITRSCDVCQFAEPFLFKA